MTLDIGAKAKAGGVVEILMLDDGKTTRGLGMPFEAAVTAAIRILAAAASSAEASASPTRMGEPLDGVTCLRVSGIGLSSGAATEPHALIVHIGTARFGISLENMQLAAFGQALLAASAPQSRKQ